MAQAYGPNPRTTTPSGDTATVQGHRLRNTAISLDHASIEVSRQRLRGARHPWRNRRTTRLKAYPSVSVGGAELCCSSSRTGDLSQPSLQAAYKIDQECRVAAGQYDDEGEARLDVAVLVK